MACQSNIEQTEQFKFPAHGGGNPQGGEGNQVHLFNRTSGTIFQLVLRKQFYA